MKKISKNGKMNTELVVDSLAKGKTNSESLQDLEKREKTEGKQVEEPTVRKEYDNINIYINIIY